MTFLSQSFITIHYYVEIIFLTKAEQLVLVWALAVVVLVPLPVWLWAGERELGGHDARWEEQRLGWKLVNHFDPNGHQEHCAGTGTEVLREGEGWCDCKVE